MLGFFNASSPIYVSSLGFDSLYYSFFSLKCELSTNCFHVCSTYKIKHLKHIEVIISTMETFLSSTANNKRHYKFSFVQEEIDFFYLYKNFSKSLAKL